MRILNSSICVGRKAVEGWAKFGGLRFLLYVAVVFLGMSADLARAGTVADSVKGNLFVYRDKQLEPFDEAKMGEIKYFALYYSAHWCPPCRLFTPKLVQFYNNEKKQHPEFELLFFSADNSQGEMLEYMKVMKMAWPAVGFRKDGPLLKLRGQGIPCLVIVDENGKVLADTFENGKYVGPEKPMAALGKLLAKGKNAGGGTASDFDSLFKKNPGN